MSRRRSALALVVGTLLLVVLAPPATAATRTPAAIPTPCDLPLVGDACDAVAGVPGDLLGGAADAALNAFTGWAASGITDLLRTTGEAIFSGTEVDLFAPGSSGTAWFDDNYSTMGAIGLALFAPMLLLAVLHAMFSQSGAVLGRALLHLPIAAMGTGAAVVVVQAVLDITDSFSSTILNGTASNTEDFLSGIFGALRPSGGAGISLGVLVVGLLLGVASLLVWIELVVREAAIFLAVLFLPLAFAAYIWPALTGWLRRLVEVIAALILSKLVVVAALALAASALANQDGFAALVAGAALFLLAAFAPFALFKLIPIGEMAAMSALEGQGRKAVGTATPRLSTAYYLQGMRGRSARGAGGSSAGAAGGGGAGAAASGAGPGAAAGGGMAGGGAGGAAASAGPAAPVVVAGAAAGAAARAGARRARAAAAGASSPGGRP